MQLFSRGSRGPEGSNEHASGRAGFPQQQNVTRIMIGRPKLVLASGSPRRLSLLNQARIDPDLLLPADINEQPLRGELPRTCANRLARAKAEAALAAVRTDEDLKGAFGLVGDTDV